MRSNLRTACLTITVTVVISAAGCASQPTVRDADLRILDKNVLGGTYVVCASAIRWDGVAFKVEGLEGNLKAKTFTLGKLTFEPTQVRELNNMALGIDALFRQMCQSTIALRNNPKALAEYVSQRDKTALELFKLLKEMEGVNRAGGEPAQIVKKQSELYDAALANPK